jgi:hypothetical protein
MTPLSITPSVGSVLTFNVYTIQPRTKSYAVTAFQPRYSTDARVDGDLLELPNPITVRVLMDEASHKEAYEAAYSVIATANLATQVVTYEGTQAVDGIVSASIEVENPHLFLTLVFAPTGAA